MAIAMLIKRLSIPLCIFGLILMTALVTPCTVHAATQATVVSSTSYLDSSGYYTIVGEVQNTGDVALGFVRITAVCYNVSKGVVARYVTWTYIDFLEVSRKSPFSITLMDVGQSAKVHDYSLSLRVSESSSKPLFLQILSNSSYVDSNGCLNVVGEIENTGSKTARWVEVAATFYGGDGKVIGAAFTYLDPADISPGGKAPFNVSLSSDRTPLAKSYALEARSEEYSLVPEFQNPLLILIFSLIIAILAMRKRVA